MWFPRGGGHESAIFQKKMRYSANEVAHARCATAIEDNFSVGSYAQIDLSALLSDAATLNNLGEYVSVNYDANTDQAVISIDRDGAASAYQSQDLLILTHQTTDVTLNDLLKNNQIII